jgi:hypothetical protein
MHECVLTPSYGRSICSTCIICNGKDDTHKLSEISEYTVSSLKINSYFSFILKIFPCVGQAVLKLSKIPHVQ